MEDVSSNRVTVAPHNVEKIKELCRLLDFFHIVRSDCYPV
jgi:hypothetical protein